MLWEDMLEIPLYTHPVKELTDEEIIRFAQNIFYFDESYSKNLGEDAIRFAKAIMKRCGIISGTDK